MLCSHVSIRDPIRLPVSVISLRPLRSLGYYILAPLSSSGLEEMLYTHTRMNDLFVPRARTSMGKHERLSSLARHIRCNTLLRRALLLSG